MADPVASLARRNGGAEGRGAAAAALIQEGLSFWTSQAVKAATGQTTIQNLVSMSALLDTDYSKLVADAAAKGIAV